MDHEQNARDWARDFEAECVRIALCTFLAWSAATNYKMRIDFRTVHVTALHSAMCD